MPEKLEKIPHPKHNGLTGLRKEERIFWFGVDLLHLINDKTLRNYCNHMLQTNRLWYGRVEHDKSGNSYLQVPEVAELSEMRSWSLQHFQTSNEQEPYDKEA